MEIDTFEYLVEKYNKLVEALEKAKPGQADKVFANTTMTLDLSYLGITSSVSITVIESFASILNQALTRLKVILESMRFDRNEIIDLVVGAIIVSLKEQYKDVTNSFIEKQCYYDPGIVSFKEACFRIQFGFTHLPELSKKLFAIIDTLEEDCLSLAAIYYRSTKVSINCRLLAEASSLEFEGKAFAHRELFGHMNELLQKLPVGAYAADRDKRFKLFIGAFVVALKNIYAHREITYAALAALFHCRPSFLQEAVITFLTSISHDIPVYREGSYSEVFKDPRIDTLFNPETCVFYPNPKEATARSSLASSETITDFESVVL